MILKCPICKQPVDSDTNSEFPFCSGRCRERDLGNWAMEKYKVAVPMMDERLRCYELHIGLVHLAYCAFAGRDGDLQEVAQRMAGLLS